MRKITGVRGHDLDIFAFSAVYYFTSDCNKIPQKIMLKYAKYGICLQVLYNIFYYIKNFFENIADLQFVTEYVTALCYNHIN